MESIPQLFTKLHEILPEIENNSYFDLTDQAKEVLSHFEGTNPDVPRIEAWSFVPHPNVLKAFTGRHRNLRRYIMTIDAMRSKIYIPIRDFLLKQTTNVTSYYTGGWADFICDVQMDPESFEGLLADIRAVLIDNGIQEIYEDDEEDGEVAKNISVFEVEEALYLCRMPIPDLAIPSAAAIEEVLRDRNLFENVFRDYRSDTTIQLFGGDENKVKEYLDKLKRDGIIVCFKMVIDYSFGITRDYVPVFLGGPREERTAANRLLKLAKDDKNLLKPVREWLKVKPKYPADSFEEEINYFFLNEYEYPGERTKWKQAIYNVTKVDVNLYNYPLESTLNESAINLSDLPEVLNKAKKYQRDADRRLLFGRVVHQSLPDTHTVDVALAVSGLPYQGVTLGASGMGKTNADLVIASEATEVLDTVVLLDASRGIEGKLDTLPANAKKKLQRHRLSADNMDELIELVTTKKGFFFLDADKDIVAEGFSNLLKVIEGKRDITSGNKPRKMRGLLLVEEAGDVLGGETKELKANVSKLRQLLVKAWRKGWCIWLSTQKPSALGHDTQSASKILKLLKNRVLLGMRESDELEIIMEVFQNEGLAEKDLKYIRTSLMETGRGIAIVRGIEMVDDKERDLPPLKTQVRLLKAD